MKNKKRSKYLLLLILLLAVSVGYALLSTTLKINGTATISKNNWSVYWANPVVTEGSVTTTAPTLSPEENQTLNTIATWSTTLSLPGDFYEFTIDAVNNGTINAMITDIENTVTPALPNYVSYTVTYADGVAIGENHLLPKKTGNTATTEKYKVRVEFLDTITPEQMEAIPEGGLSYTFNYHITYSQATDAATAKPVKWVLPEGKTANTLAVGDEICSGLSGIDDQCFNFIRYDGNDVVMLAKYNLKVGHIYNGTTDEGTYTVNDEGYGLQSSETLGWVDNSEYSRGTVTFSTSPYWDHEEDFPVDVYDSTNYDGAPTALNYSVAYYVKNYKSVLNSYGLSIKSARLLTLTEATNNVGCSSSEYSCPNGFITNTTFWTGTAQDITRITTIFSSGYFYMEDYDDRYMDDMLDLGVRPVIVVEKSNL